MTKKQVRTCCIRCNTPLTFGKGFDEKKHKPLCSPGCRDAEKLFSMMFSDEEINRRAHYYSLTKGDTDDRRLGA